MGSKSKILEITDFYNNDKVWVIKITECGHYYMNQKICGRMFYNRFAKTSKQHLEAVGVFKFDEWRNKAVITEKLNGANLMKLGGVV